MPLRSEPLHTALIQWGNQCHPAASATSQLPAPRQEQQFCQACAGISASTPLPLCNESFHNAVVQSGTPLPPRLPQAPWQGARLALPALGF